MATVIEKKKKYTYKDYVKIPDDKRYELIGSELLITPSPTTKHQMISERLGYKLRTFISKNRLGEIFYAPCDVYLDEENVVQPDIMFISKERLNIIEERNVQGAPCITIEIISERSAYRDMVQKKKLYARFGIKEYWIVIPEEESIEVYSLENGIYQLYKTYRKDETLESRKLKGLEIELSDMF